MECKEQILKVSSLSTSASSGYETMPVRWGDRLVARFDSKLDRTSTTFVILGFWLEDMALGRD